MTEFAISCTDFHSLEENIIRNFNQTRRLDTLARIIRIKDNALVLANRFVIDYEQAKTAALLAEISCLVSKDKYLEIADNCGLEIYPAEREDPLLLRQRISRIIAVDSFNIVDKEVLNAIACHTTLRKEASSLDKLLFLADKMALGDDSGAPVFMPLVKKAAEVSLDNAVKCYFENLMLNQPRAKTLHPWLLEAWEEIRG